MCVFRNQVKILNVSHISINYRKTFYINFQAMDTQPINH